MENTSLPGNITLSEWQMPFPFVLITMIYLIINILISLIINMLLIMIMNSSPSLRTPPNSHLMNICANNLITCVGMIFSLVCINLNTLEIGTETSNILSGAQLFVVFNSLLQYWGTFAAIGFYRRKTINQPGLSLRKRRRLVSRCIKGNWIVSLILSMTCSLSFVQSSAYLISTFDPFRPDFLVAEYKAITPEQLIITFIFLAIFIIQLIIILSSYYSICKMLNITGQLAKNRVKPWNESQPKPVQSDNRDLTLSINKPEDNNTNPSPYTISGTILSEDAIVHFQKCDQSIAFEDIIAFENPTLAPKIRQHYQYKRTLRQTMSNGSTTSTTSKSADFTDISKCDDQDRSQMIKNNIILKNQSLKRDRISLSSSIKNSLVMLSAFILCSMPLLICSIPGALNMLEPQTRVIILLFCRLLFYMNAPIYPLWYLIFSKRVRTCLSRLGETILFRLNVLR